MKRIPLNASYDPVAELEKKLEHYKKFLDGRIKVLEKDYLERKSNETKKTEEKK